MIGFKTYDKQELFDRIEKISITRTDNLIITKYNDNIINTTEVSNRYEIFDIVKYLKDKIDSIEKNFPIYKYRLEVRGGKQSLQLISDKVKIGEVEFHKSFYIMNSTDRSRRLSFNIGLKSDNGFYVVGKNASLSKKHLKGVTKAAEDASQDITGETFNQQIESIESLVGHRIKFSKMREVILGDVNFDDVSKINHRKFDAFKMNFRYSTSFHDKFSLNNDQKTMIIKRSEDLTNIPDNLDFDIDAFWAFQIYLRIFNNQDSHIVKNETERILKMTQWAIRNRVLESIGI